MPSQQSLSSHSVFLIPWDTSANNPSKAKVFHIMKVESKSISYHAFSLSFSLSLFSSAGQGEREQSADLEPLPDCLPSLAIEYLSLTSYASSSSTTSALGTDKGSENDTSKHAESMC
ncbi:hypothetical protein ACFX13_000215 [Malus domestica]